MKLKKRKVKMSKVNNKKWALYKKLLLALFLPETVKDNKLLEVQV